MRRRQFNLLPALVGFTGLLCLALLFPTSCRADAPASPEPNRDQFVGSLDEVIGPRGGAVPGFSDADFVQLLRPDDIPPIYEPAFIPAAEAALPDEALVIGLSIGDDHRAYPAGILFNREMVNDVVDELPVLVSWCPRCYTALVHDRRIDGEAVRFGNHGALYLGAMTWFDHPTGTIWSQPLGTAVVGPLAGARLPLIPSELAVWKDWLSAHPDTLVLADSRPAQPFSGNLPGPDHVVGIVVDGEALAIPYHRVPFDHAVRVRVNDTPVEIWREVATQAVRAAQLNHRGDHRRDVPVLMSYRSSWLKFYPHSVHELPVDSQ